ncbi:MAG: gamma-glutamyltransferase [Thermodesulfobacteriota bacterium]
MYDKSIIASGHELVSEAAARVLEQGGNAFDAVVAAGFASSVVEPALTSLGGGGLLLGHSAAIGQDLFFDFFVDTPGKDSSVSLDEPHFFPVTVSFSGSDQDFNVGMGSVAVPGTLKGLLHIHERLGHMNLRDVMTPAIEYARGHQVNEQQGTFLHLLKPIMKLMEPGRALYQPEGQYLVPGATLVNSDLAQFLEQIVLDRGDSFYLGDISKKIHEEMVNGDGLLTRKDLADYRVYERKPLTVNYRGNRFVTASTPSMGGPLIGLSLGLRAKADPPAYDWGTIEHLTRLTGLMKEVEKLRSEGVSSAETLSAFLEDSDRVKVSEDSIRLFPRGTTHVSIADKHGNCASMTSSNGEGSGYFAPGTGVMLNNMMGEDDLHPDGFHSSPPGLRVGSMMSPSLLVRDGEVRLVIGSGGSKRIRTAISQVLSQVVDFNRPLQKAVDAPRLYLDGDLLQVEPGFAPEVIKGLSEIIEVNQWQDKDVYFGGVHAVVPGKEGAGDGRRGGIVRIVS